MGRTVLQDFIGEEAREAFGRKDRWIILPLGSTEYHGPRGPFGTDADVAWEVGRKVAEATGALLLPVLPYGDSAFHKDYVGTIHLERATLKMVLLDIAASVRRHGAEKMLLLLGHWGNQEAALETKAALDEMKAGPRIEVARVFDPAMLDVPGMDRVFGGSRWAGHGGAVEVSVALYARPHVIPPPAAEMQGKWPAPVERDYAKLGWAGLPEDASAERGEKAIEIAALSIVGYLRN